MSRLTTVFGSDTSGVQRGLQQMRGQVQGFSRNISGMLLRGFSVVAIVAGFRQIVQELDRIDKLSRRFGAGTDFLQDLDAQAKLSGASLETVVRGMSRLIGELNRAGGPSSMVAQEIKALGLEVDDLRGLSMDELFNVISETIGNLASETDQLTASQNLMGRSAGEILPLIQDLYESGGLAEAPRHTQEAIDATVQMNDALTHMGTTIKTFASPVIVLLTSLVQGLMRTLKTLGETIANVGIAFVNQFATMANGVRTIAQNLTRLFENLGNLVRAVFTFRRGEIADAVAQMTDEFKRGLEEIRSEPLIDREQWRQDWKRAGRDLGSWYSDMGDLGLRIGRGFGLLSSDSAPAPAGRERTGTRTTEDDETTDHTEALRKLRGEEAGLIDSLKRLRDTFEDPRAMAVSSLQAAGGGGRAVGLGRDQMLNLAKTQVQKLEEIRLAIQEKEGVLE